MSQQRGAGLYRIARPGSIFYSAGKGALVNSKGMPGRSMISGNPWAVTNPYPGFGAHAVKPFTDSLVAQ